MKALVYTAPETLAFETREAPEPRHGETLVDVALCGICGSDMHAYLGHDERRPAPLILGHEAAGVTRDGRRVVVNPLVTCGTCEACRTGRDNLCSTRQIISMPPRPGAFAGVLSMPERNLLPVPTGLTLERAALTEPLACGWHAAKLALKHGGESLDSMAGDRRPLVLGGGAIGIASSLALVAQGAPGVLVSEPNRSRWDAIAAAGPFEPVLPDAAAGFRPFLIIDAYGAGGTRRMATAVVRPGGVIVHIGLGDAEPGLDARRLTLQEISLVGAYTYTAAEFAETLQAAAAGLLGPLDWFEERPIEEGIAAFRNLHAGRVASPKILLRVA